MGGSALSRIYFFVAIVGVFFALVGFYWAFQSSIQKDVQIAQNKIAGKDIISTGPSVSIEKIADGKIRIYWERLPANSKTLEVFRSLLAKRGWEKWKVIELPQNSGMSGSIDLDLGTGENTNDYQFYIQTLNEAGNVAWTGPVTKAFAPPQDLFPSAFQPSQSDGDSNDSITPSLESEGGSTEPFQNTTPTTEITSEQPSGVTPPTSQPPAQAPNVTNNPTAPTTTTTSTTTTSNTTSTTNTPTSTSTTGTDLLNNPYIIYYYSPDGRIVGTSSAQITLNFWVQYINRHIELGWQNLPPQTTLVKVFRSSQNENGPWEKLMEQSNINPIGPVHMRLIDSSMDIPHWYKVEAWVDSTLLGTFGPVYLEALSNQ